MHGPALSPTAATPAWCVHPPCVSPKARGRKDCQRGVEVSYARPASRRIGPIYVESLGDAQKRSRTGGGVPKLAKIDFVVMQAEREWVNEGPGLSGATARTKGRSRLASETSGILM